jgi:hypothetical protein
MLTIQFLCGAPGVYRLHQFMPPEIAPRVHMESLTRPSYDYASLN